MLINNQARTRDRDSDRVRDVDGRCRIDNFETENENSNFSGDLYHTDIHFDQ